MVGLLIFSVVIIGMFYLQVKLSKNKYLGLIMPVMFFIFSSFILLSNVMFSEMAISSEHVEESKYNEVGDIIEIYSYQIDSNGSAVEHSSNFALSGFNLVVLFLYFNIPTILLLLVYFVVRNNVKKKNLINKMKIQDL